MTMLSDVIGIRKYFAKISQSFFKITHSGQAETLTTSGIQSVLIQSDCSQ